MNHKDDEAFAARSQNMMTCCAPAHGEHSRIAPAKITPDAKRDCCGMLQLAGGRFLMGTNFGEAHSLDGEGPVREVNVNAVWMDRHPVTNASFEEFVTATGYRTDAEQFGWSYVFWSHISRKMAKGTVIEAVPGAPWWYKVPGAFWRTPEGPDSSVDKRRQHPVVHVSWNDAVSFCEWSGRRLPTEAEWEYAARGGLEQKLYPWGDKLRPGGEHRCNIWQGEFPQNDTGDDGYRGTCPVQAFPPNGYGLYSMTGNTWEWCSDWFSATDHVYAPRTNPQGPSRGEAKVIKGGSFLCHKSYCNRYRVAARSSNTPESSTSHMSFRCARDV